MDRLSWAIDATSRKVRGCRRPKVVANSLPTAAAGVDGTRAVGGADETRAIGGADGIDPVGSGAVGTGAGPG